METEYRSLSIRIPAKLHEEIDRITTKRKLNRTQTAVMLLDLGVDLHKDLEKAGIISAIDFAYYVRQSLKEKLRDSVKGNQLHLPI